MSALTKADPFSVRPIWDVCDRQVERMDTWRDEGGNRTMFRVYCHGDEDTGWLDDIDLPSGAVVNVRAFRVKRLAPADQGVPASLSQAPV